MRFLSFCLTTILTVFLNSCVQYDSDPVPHETLSNVLITDELTELDITAKCSFYIGDDVPIRNSVTEIEGFIAENFKRNNREKMIRFGGLPEAKTGWVYIQLVNKSTVGKELYIEANYRRSDGIRGYLIVGDSLRNFGEVKRTTPYYERAYPTLGLSLPFQIAANSTSGLLVRSERFANLHVLGLSIYDTYHYQKQATLKQYFELGNSSALTLIIIVFTILAAFFRDNLLLALTIFLTNVLLLFLSFNGYLDFINYSDNIGLSTSNATGFLNLIANATFHPLGYFIVASTIKKRKSYFWVSGILLLLNLSVAFCYLVDSSVYLWLDKYINHIIISLSSINILWAIVHAYIHFRRSRKIWYLIATLTMLLPLAIKFILELLNVEIFRSDDPYSYFSSYILIFAFSYIAFLQLKKKLVLKSEADRQVLQVSQSLNELNLNEIKKIGRNLHDQVGNTLASALGYLNMNVDKKSKAKKLIKIAILEIRLISHNIIKQDAGEFTTWHIEQLIERMNDFSAINYHFKDYSENGLRRLNAIERQNIYNIIQELLTNILKHSKATDAFVEIFDDENKLRINVEDNGVGFDTGKDYNGIGLQNIRSRVEILAFRYILESTDKGVTALIEVNYEN